MGFEEQAPKDPTKKRKSFLEKQPYLFTYGFGISLFSPTASCYQLLRLNPQVKVKPTEGIKLALKILPHQTLLKATQMNISTPVREYFNPWAAFFLVGVIQGGVYGQANIYFSKALNIGKAVSYAGLFRGYLFAGCRDTVAQGVPYTFSKIVERDVLHRFHDTLHDPTGTASVVKKWGALIGTSMIATLASQWLHNLQITMHADQSINHLQAFQQAYKRNGISLFYKGAEARVGILLIVNLLNEIVLKKAWE